jgi:hypothetical protein
VCIGGYLPPPRTVLRVRDLGFGFGSIRASTTRCGIDGGSGH